MSASTAGRTRPLELRRRWPGLRPLWRANACSLTGTETYDLVLLMFTTPAYAEVLAVGPLGLALRLGPAVLGPIVSAALDRRPRNRARFIRYITLARALLVAVFAASLYALPGVSLVLYALILAISTLDAIFLAGVRATVPRLFTSDPQKSHLAGANSMLISQWTTIQIAVPSAAVVLLEVVDPTVVVLATSALFILSYTQLASYVKAVEATYTGTTTEQAKPGLWVSLRTGVTTVWADAVSRAVLVMTSVGQGVMFTLLMALPVVASARGLGGWAVGVGLGTLSAGALVGAKLGGRLVDQGLQVRMLVADPLLRVASLVIFALAAHPVPMLGACLLMGFTAGGANVAKTSLLQNRFHDDVLGRVLVLAAVVNQALMPVMPVVWDAARQRLGLAGGFGVMAGALVVAVVAALFSSRLRDLLRGSPA